MEKKKRNIALVILICILAVIVLSSVFIPTNAEHTCIGENCLVCEQVSFCVMVLCTIGIALGGWIAFSLFKKRADYRGLFRLSVITLRNHSLLLLKVKLNL
ncbi:MAG: hypothetical protein LBU41_00350 [Clostridiales Family XIII bacterium]|nr:hypothetical protein [Clostridiales Family XIII bacterium]